MTLKLEQGTSGKVAVKTHGVDDSMSISIGRTCAVISDEDMYCLVMYWLTNSDALKNGVKTKLVREIKKSKIEKAFFDTDCPDHPLVKNRVRIAIPGYIWWRK